MTLSTLLRQAPATAASSAAGPSSIAPSLGAASQPGDTLLLAVVNTNASGTITTPAGWTAIQSNIGPTGLDVGLFLLPGALNSGIQSVTVTLGGTTGGAVAALFNFIGASPITLDTSAIQSATSNSYANLALAATSQYGELLFYVCGFAAATLTPSNSADWSGAIGTAVSTSGAPNAQIACFWQVTPKGITPTIGGGLSASVLNQQAIARFFIPGSNVSPAGPGEATFIGAGGNPAGSLQVPQPQAPGNFFSGTTGSF